MSIKTRLNKKHRCNCIVIFAFLFLLVSLSVCQHFITTRTSFNSSYSKPSSSQTKPDTYDIIKDYIETPRSGLLLNTYDKIPKSEPSFRVLSSDPSDPAVLDVYYFNASNNERITWAKPGDDVWVGVKLKGPFHKGDTIYCYFKKHVVDRSPTTLVWGYYTFDFDLGVNETIYLQFAEPITIDPDVTIYGGTPGKVNAYFIVVEKGGFLFNTVIYDGENDTGHYLWIWGSILVKEIIWYRVVNDSKYEIDVAEPGWIFYPVINLVITNAPVWNFDFALKLRFDVVWWFDEDFASLSTYIYDSIQPGSYSVYFVDDNGSVTVSYTHLTLPTTERV